MPGMSSADQRSMPAPHGRNPGYTLGGVAVRLVAMQKYSVHCTQRQVVYSKQRRDLRDYTDSVTISSMNRPHGLSTHGDLPHLAHLGKYILYIYRSVLVFLVLYTGRVIGPSVSC